ncbi:hypothetical protein LJK88_07405 [Paenibacillus sp. P26]|nr:hypothetical protein LJK88_07405 [Paenibacillus sp. P26]UUZ97841.1 hypothetical protein LJK87_30170 [Paenibacillus sp. P25]
MEQNEEFARFLFVKTKNSDFGDFYFHENCGILQLFVRYKKQPIERHACAQRKEFTTKGPMEHVGKASEEASHGEGPVPF